MTSERPGRIGRDLHPVAWWLWAVGLAAAATFTTNPWLLLVLTASAALVVAARRSPQPWGATFRLYLWLALVVVVVRVAFRIIFPTTYPGTVVLDLPAVPLPDWVLGLSLFGPVTRESLLDGLYFGLQLATIVICIGAANSLANPKRLLRSVPPALHEVGTALVVAVTVLPQLTESLSRVRAAQSLREGETGRVRGLRRTIVPVLEDALERSLALAAGMDTRGYGRTPGLDARQRRVTGGLLLLGLAGVCVGGYALLDKTAPRWLAAPMLLLGVAASVAGLWSAGRRVPRTRYRPDRWRLPELLVAACGLGTAVVARTLTRAEPQIAYPVGVTPALSLLSLCLLVGALAAVLSPPPREVAS